MKNNKTVKDIYNTKLALLYMFSNAIFTIVIFTCFNVFYDILPSWNLVFTIPGILCLICCNFIERALNKKYIKEVIYNEKENN